MGAVSVAAALASGRCAKRRSAHRASTSTDGAQYEARRALQRRGDRRLLVDIAPVDRAAPGVRAPVAIEFDVVATVAVTFPGEAARTACGSMGPAVYLSASSIRSAHNSTRVTREGRPAIEIDAPDAPIASGQRDHAVVIARHRRRRLRRRHQQDPVARLAEAERAGVARSAQRHDDPRTRRDRRARQHAAERRGRRDRARTRATEGPIRGCQGRSIPRSRRRAQKAWSAKHLLSARSRSTTWWWLKEDDHPRAARRHPRALQNARRGQTRGEQFERVRRLL